ncbi:uncharacterized protein LOC123524175 [Mercenaria mercenaria]|uniref:uncharacterized protein LOC123524175 n=1 Tax=Mercenaria mercenaria TaxID=6596 RepID=UPI00234E5869|nr:uncharacterized protein LOC123524175 [Mercenaria mercenaria]
MKTKHTDTFQPDKPAQQKVQKVQRDVKSKAFTDELKVKVARKSISTTKEGPLPPTKPTCSQPSGPVSESSFVSIRGATEESMSLLSVREQESLYENDTDSSNDSDNTSPKTIYENPEELESMKVHRFERYEYFCDQKIKVRRLLNRKAIGVFAIFPGESTEHELCVMTPKGLKYFRIYSQNERVSLYRSHQYNTFPALDDLLSYYSANDLPGADYSVKLQRGYNSMS